MGRSLFNKVKRWIVFKLVFAIQIITFSFLDCTVQEKSGLALTENVVFVNKIEQIQVSVPNPKCSVSSRVR